MVCQEAPIANASYQEQVRVRKGTGHHVIRVPSVAWDTHFSYWLHGFGVDQHEANEEGLQQKTSSPNDRSKKIKAIPIALAIEKHVRIVYASNFFEARPLQQTYAIAGVRDEQQVSIRCARTTERLEVS